jgi:hypothetical protein
MNRCLAVIALSAMLAGCSGTAIAPPAVDSSSLQAASFSRSHEAARALSKCPANPNGSGILPDGDFSRAVDTGHHYTTFYKGQGFAPSWRVVKRTSDFLGSQWWPVGFCIVDLDGINVGGIGHSGFRTIPGTMYTVTFMLSGNSDCPPTVKTMIVTAAHQSGKFTWNVANGNDAQHDKFGAESWSFVAAGHVSTLEFLSEDPRGNRGCGAVVGFIAVAPS